MACVFIACMFLVSAAFAQKFHTQNNSYQHVQDSENVQPWKSSILSQAQLIFDKLHYIANHELGARKLQETFNDLPFVETEDNDMSSLENMVKSLDHKYKLYNDLVKEMAKVVRNNYKMKSNTKNAKESFILEYIHQEFDDNHHEQQQYYPCCVIPDHYLRYDPHFGTHINTELWCDSGLGEEATETSIRHQLAPYQLTNLFTHNRKSHPSIKWQYFLSSKGIHTEYPAHRPGTSVGSDCGQSSRHHRVWESTVRSHGRNVILLFDLGNTVRPRLLLTAKAIGHYVVNTLTDRDNIGVIGIAGSITRPAAPCMKYIRPATHDVKRMVENYVDYMQTNDEPTNHSLGLHACLDMVNSWPKKQSPVLVMYISRGWTSTERMKNVMISLGNRVDQISNNIIFSTYGLGVSLGETSIQKDFLQAIAHQSYSDYGVFPRKLVTRGQVIGLLPTLRVVSIMRNFYEVVDNATKPITFNTNTLKNYLNRNIKMSEPYWDKEGHGMIVSFSEAVYMDSGHLAGVVGIDISMSHLLEDATYFTSPTKSHAFVINDKGDILYHRKMGRPDTWKLPILPTPVTWVESGKFFQNLMRHIIKVSHGRKVWDKDYKPTEYLWWRSHVMNWTFIINRQIPETPLWKISPKVSPIPAKSIFHRLDFLLPQEARVCRHFSQMATLDAPTVFLPSGSFKHPTDQVGKLTYDTDAHSKIMSYLSDPSGTQENPGLKDGVKEETAALYHLTKLWKELFRLSRFQKFIVRRYGASSSGTMLTYPGTLLDISFEPRTQAWFFEAMENPNDIIVSSPFLDPGGSGYIVTVSHSVSQGVASSQLSQRPLAVLGADFSLGFWHKILADVNADCADTIYFKDNNATDSHEVRCFLMDTAGYVISHSHFVSPYKMEKENIFPRHIAQQEPVLTMSLLSKPLVGSQSVLVKHWCGKWWHRGNQRLYSVNINANEIISSPSEGKTDNSCLSYKLTRIPNSNLILGILNQTCPTATSFCPCNTNTVEKRCLTCQMMEASACECPCECPLPVRPCDGRPAMNILQQGYRSTKGSFLRTKDPNTSQPLLSCDRQAEPSGMMNYGIGMLSQLSVCVPTKCSEFKNESACLGVIDCVWCVLETDMTVLTNPSCTNSHICYGGILGSGSPYPRGVSPMKHLEDREGFLPVGQILGGIFGFLLILGLLAYCYRGYISNTIAAPYTPTILHAPPTLPYSPDVRSAEASMEGLLEDRILTADAVATLSPYRMNPTYRRPVQHGEPSDPGYSTMTPHDDTETVSAFPVDDGKTNENWSDHSDKSCQISDNDISPVKKLSSPKKIGPNKLLVPVTVHKGNSD